MKFSLRQILASTAGAVIAALIASTFGVKGTIIGVAIGSAAATIGTALVAQSIEHGQKAVKQVVVRAPDSSPLLRKLGATGASGDTASSVGDSAAPTAAMAASGADAETVEMESATESVGETGRLEISAVAGAPASERMQASTTPVLASGQTGRSRGPRRFTWTAIAGTAAIVFVLALMFITAIELISGKPLAAIFGNAGSGTSVHDFFTPSPSPTPSPTTTTTSTTTSTTTTSTSSSTTTSASTTTTSTTAPTGTSTTTTSTGTSTTTTSGNPAVSGTSTTTTAPNR